MFVRVATMVATLMFLAADAFSANSMPAQSQPASVPAASQPATTPAGPSCVAIIEPEVLADLPAEERKALAGAVDALLTESLAGQKGFVLVDRQMLDKVLAEKVGETGGVTKVAVGEVSEPLRPFWAAGVLVCTQVDVKAQVTVVEAVSAQTGQLIAGLYASGKMASADDVAKVVGPKLQPFAESIISGVVRIKDKPLLEISGKLAGGLARLAWMVDDLTDAAGAKVAAGDKVVWLVPRQPLVTKEERLLRAMGLAEANKGDAVAGLSPVPQMRLTFELTDSAKTGVTFEKTPISLKLSLGRGPDKPVATQIEGEAGQWEECRDKALVWLEGQLTSKPLSAEQKGDQEERARQMSREELAALGPFADISIIDRDYRLRTKIVFDRILSRASRAAHLDPTNEQAAYLVHRAIMELCRTDEAKPSMLGLYNRGIVEAKHYLDRFPRASPTRRLEMLANIGWLGGYASQIIYGKDGNEKDAILLPPRVEAYPYARDAACYVAEAFYLTNTDRRYATSNYYRHFSWFLYYDLIRCIPEDKVDEEYEYWRTYYAQKVEPIVEKKQLDDFLNTRPLPWPMIDALFQVRKKNVEGVKNAFQQLAREFPAEEKFIWGGTFRPDRVPLLLKAAGAKDWQTWRPNYSTRERIKIDLDEMTGFLASLTGAATAPWELSKAPILPAQKIDVPQAGNPPKWPEGWDLARVETMFMAGDNLWIIVQPQFFGTPQSKYALFVSPLEKMDSARVRFNPIEVPWPQAVASQEGMPKPIVWTVWEDGGNLTVWLGTAAHGVARFDKVDGRWRSRWYTQRDGLPSNSTEMISIVRSGGSLLVRMTASRDTTRDPKTGRLIYRGYQWTLDPRTDKVVLLEDTSEPATSPASRPASRPAGEPVPAKVKPPPPLPGGEGGRYYVFPFLEAQTIFGIVGWRTGCEYTNVYGSYPGVTKELSVARGQTLWVAFRVGDYDRSARWVVGYGPAPAADDQRKPTDRWIGPFCMPDQATIRAMTPYGDNGLLLTTGSGMYLFDCDEAIKVAQSQGQVCSSKQWREQFEQRLAAGDWRRALAELLARQKWEQAEQLLDQQRTSSPKDRLALTLWKAHLLARTNKLSDAAGAYSGAATDAASQRNHPAEVFARMNQIMVLYKVERYQEMLDLCRAVNERFTQTIPERVDDRLKWYIEDARKKLAAQTRPATGPAVSPVR